MKRTDFGDNVAVVEFDVESADSSTPTETLSALLANCMSQRQFIKARIMAVSAPCGKHCTVSLSVGMALIEVEKTALRAYRLLSERAKTDPNVPISGFRAALDSLGLLENEEENEEKEQIDEEGEDKIDQKTWKFSVN